VNQTPKDGHGSLSVFWRHRPKQNLSFSQRIRGRVSFFKSRYDFTVHAPAIQFSGQPDTLPQPLGHSNLKPISHLAGVFVDIFAHGGN